MLILIGVAPTAYALNRAPPGRPRRPVRHRGARRFEDRRSPWRRIRHHRRSSSGGDANTSTLTRSREGTYPSLAVLTKEISDSVEQYGSVAKTPFDKVQNLRNDMYLASEGFRVLAKDKESELSAADKTQIAGFKKELDCRPNSSRSG